MSVFSYCGVNPEQSKCSPSLVYVCSLVSEASLALLMKCCGKKQLEELPRTWGMEERVKNTEVGTPFIKLYVWYQKKPTKPKEIYAHLAQGWGLKNWKDPSEGKRGAQHKRQQPAQTVCSTVRPVPPPILRASGLQVVLGCSQGTW